MTTDLQDVSTSPRDTSTRRGHRLPLSGTMLPIALSAIICGVWIELAFFHNREMVFAAFICLAASVVFGGIFFAMVQMATLWDLGITEHFQLRQHLSRASLASIIFILYLPEYLARLQPPMLRSSLLLAAVLFLWLALCAASVSHVRGIVLSDRVAQGMGASAVITLFVLATSLAIRKYWVFGYVGQDLAYFSQILHTTLRGHLFWGNLLQDLLYTRPVTTDFAGHNSPVMFLFLPFYSMFPSPITLIVLRNIVLFACSIPIVLFARQRDTEFNSWLWAVAFLLTPTIFYQTTFDFYPLTFAALPVLYALYFYEVHRYTAFCVALGFALLVREDLVFFVFGLGIIALIQRRALRWSIIPLVAATGWAYASFVIVMPTALHGASFVTDACFCHLGDTRLSMVHNVISHPTNNVLLHVNIVYLKSLLTPTGIVLSLGSVITPLALPFLAINLLAGGGKCITNVIYAQYSLIPATLIFFGALSTLTSKKQRSFLKKSARLGLHCRSTPSLLLLTLSIAGLIFSTGKLQKSELTDQTWGGEARHVLRMIPEGASVAAPRYMLPHLSNRDCLYQTQRLNEYHTIAYQYLVIDTEWEHINASQQYRASYQDLMKKATEQPTLQLIYNTPTYRVYKNTQFNNSSCSAVPSPSR